MNSTLDRYANWKAPAEDGGLVVWPDAASLQTDTRHNHEQLNAADHVRIQNLPLPVLRKEQRARFGQADDQLLVASGHQTELYHAGVWVKDVVVDAVARRLNARALHVAVDTDQPKHLQLRWPGTTLPISDDPAQSSAEWSGLIRPPSSAHLRAVRAALPALSEQWSFQPALPPFLDQLADAPAEASLSRAVTAAQHALDEQLTLRYDTVLISDVIGGPAPYLVLTHHLLANAERFAADYNAALADYRVQENISSPTRPMPDLHVAPEQIEVPFWFDNLRERTRQRAELQRTENGWALTARGDRFVFDPRADGWEAAEQLSHWLAQHELRLAPRALTLTLFLRLLVVDQFVHGIGGGRYDQVTDRLMQAHFVLEPPRFAVATATLLFPGAVGRTRVCLPCLAQEGHHLKHGLLGEQKSAVLAELASLPRRSLSRSMVFHNMHAALAAAAVGSPVLRDWETRFAAAQERDRQDEVIFDRELFYGLQTRERLQGLIDRVNAAV